MMPKIKVEKRLGVSTAVEFGVPIFSIVLGLLLGSILFLIVNINPLEAYSVLLSGSFGSLHAISETLVKAIPLMLCALGTALAFKASFWNIGAEGQLQIGAFAATWVALSIGVLPSAITIPVMFLAGFVLGGLWGAIPAFLKTKLGADEIVTTLMMNFIAIFWVYYWIYGPWRDPEAYGVSRSYIFPDNAQLPIIPGTRIHLTLFIALAAAAIVYLMLYRTKIGYEIRVVGNNPRAAIYAGMKATAVMIFVNFICGGLSGIAGVGEVAGVTKALLKGFSPGYGYTAIIIAWLAKLHPIGVIVASILFGGLLVGGQTVQVLFGIPIAIIMAFEALILFCVLGGEILKRYHITVRWER